MFKNSTQSSSNSHRYSVQRLLFAEWVVRAAAADALTLKDTQGHMIVIQTTGARFRVDLEMVTMSIYLLAGSMRCTPVNMCQSNHLFAIFDSIVPQLQGSEPSLR
jgi:hypothetical protein